MRPRVHTYLLYFDRNRYKAMSAGPYLPDDDDYRTMWAHVDALRAAGHEDIATLRSPVPPPLPPGRLIPPEQLRDSLRDAS